MFNYAAAARKAARDIRMVVLVLLACPKNGEGGRPEATKWLEISRLHEKTGGTVEDFDCSVDVHFVDLVSAAAKLRDGRPIELNKKTLQDNGRSWLKVLSVRYWGTPRGDRYIVSGSPTCADEIQNALELLECVQDQELEECTDAWKTTEALLSMERQIGMAMGMQEAKVATLKRLLAAKMTNQRICTALGISMQELDTLIKTIEQ
jgi:hypothetical protein